VLPEAIRPEGASDAAVAALNGRSSGSSTGWDHSADDYIVAEIREVSQLKDRFDGSPIYRYELCVSEGLEAGKPMPVHCHRWLIGRHTELRRMHAKLAPWVGMTIALYYGGRDDTHRPNKHLWRYGVIEQGDAGSGVESDDEI
jgi:hypothetical protein